MKKLVVDTSIIIDFLRVEDKISTILYKIAEEDLYVSIITHTELYAGKGVWEKDNVKEALDKILKGTTIVPLDIPISEQAGKIRAQKDRSLIDSIIAATASSIGAEIVTLNLKDFQGIERISIYNPNS